MVRRNAIRCLVLATISLIPSPARAEGPNSRFLPAGTKAYLGVTNWSSFLERWRTTQFSRLLNEEGLKGIQDDVNRAGIDALGLGITSTDLQAVAKGEVTWAIVRLGPEAAAQAFLIDVTGAGDKAQSLLTEIATRLQKLGYQPGTQTVAGTAVQTYKLAAREGTPGGRLLAAVIKQNVMVFTNSIPMMHEIVERLGADKENLAGLQAFQETQKHAKSRLKDTPDVVWFIDPLGLLDLQRLDAHQPRSRTKDLMQILQKQGFEAMKGIGGVIRFGGAVDAVAHTAIHAPPPHQKAMGMLAFPGGLDFTPPAWLPPGVSAYAGVSYDMKQGFKHVAPIFDAVYGEGETGVFDQVIKDLRDDPDGPRVDVAKEIIDKLESRVTLVLDNAPASSKTGAAVLVAVETKDEKTVADAVRRLMDGDPEVKKHEFQGYVLWELLERKKISKGKELAKTEVHSKVIAIAKGQVFLSDDIKFVQKTLSSKSGALHEQPDFAQVSAALKPFMGNKDWLFVFTRLGEEFQSPYEMFRRGQLAGSQLIHGQIFNGVMSVLYSAEPSRLPPFERLGQHLGLAGAVGSTIDNGWLISGVVVKKN